MIQICLARNGFLVYVGDSNPALEGDEFVFQTFDGLVEFLRGRFAPAVPKGPEPIVGTFLTEQPENLGEGAW